uniref:Uncharacterized protein n=1 Tax=Tanacetum cinerariifolium TaxID=118510 RepID=A0A6L2KXZ6_TANCI|nr:hypothetical protein [Tanacetum cinerariifolium]
MSRQTRASHVGTILTMVMIVDHGSRLPMSRNHATIKTFIEINKKKELRQLKHAANLNTYTIEPSRCFNSFCYDDDDYEESTIPLNEIVSLILPSIAITPVLPTMGPEDSLMMGDEDLNTIPKKESDEVIKSNVEDFVPIARKIRDDESLSDFTSSDDESLSDEDVPEDNVKIYSNPLFEFDDEYISSDVNPLFDEILENIENKDSYDYNLDEPDLLVTPLFDANEDGCFDPRDDIDEMLLSLSRGSPMNHLSKRMTIYLIWSLKRMNGRRFCTMLQLMI